MTSYIESKHPLHVLMETQFKQISDNNITVKNIILLNINVSQKNIWQAFGKISRDGIGVNIVSYFKNLKHHNIICLSTVKRNFNMVLLFLATYNKNNKKGPLINQYINIYRKNRFNINASGSKKNHFWTVDESYGVG